MNRRINDVLSKYGEYLSIAASVPAKHVPFYKQWVSRYINAAGKGIYRDRETPAKKLDAFIKDLASGKKYEPWQLEQARSAVYLLHESGILAGPGSGGKARSVIDLDLVVEQLRNSFRLRTYSPRTEGMYLGWVRRFFAYNGKSPSAVTSGDVKKFLTHLAVDKKVASSTQDQAFNSLLYLFRNILKKEFGDLSDTARARRKKRLPVVLSREEVGRLFSCMEGNLLLMARLVYGCGLRLAECVGLRVRDIEFDRGIVNIRHGKGDRDRTAALPKKIIRELQAHLDRVQKVHQADLQKGYGAVPVTRAGQGRQPGSSRDWGWQWVFPSPKLSVNSRTGRVTRNPIHPTNLQKAVKKAGQQAKITREAGVHTLRHSFATHLVESGYSIRTIQELLGHKNVNTTMIYSHVTQQMKKEVISPLDM